MNSIKYYYIILLNLILFVPFNSLMARHIIGGEITYECIGEGEIPNTRKYKFYMKIYRDCQGGGPSFENPASLTIHEGNTATLIANISIGLKETQLLNPSSGKPLAK